MSGINTATVSKSQRGIGKSLAELLTTFHMPTARGRGEFLTKLLMTFHMPTARGRGEFLTELLTTFHMPTARGRGEFLTELLTTFHMPTARAHKVGYSKGEVHTLTLAARSYCALAHCNRLMFLDLQYDILPWKPEAQEGVCTASYHCSSPPLHKHLLHHGNKCILSWTETDRWKLIKSRSMQSNTLASFPFWCLI